MENRATLALLRTNYYSIYLYLILQDINHTYLDAWSVVLAPCSPTLFILENLRSFNRKM